MNVRIVPLALLTVALGLFSAATAKANLIFTMQQVGPDVVVTSSGSLANTEAIPDETRPDLAVMIPMGPQLSVGLDPDNPSVAVYLNPFVSGPTHFGSGGPAVADSASGTIFDFLGPGPGNDPYVAVSLVQLANGDPFTAGTATWSGQTLASLGATPGTYVWTLDERFLGDTITLNILAPTAVPEPSALAMSGIGGLAMAGFAAYRRRRAKA